MTQSGNVFLKIYDETLQQGLTPGLLILRGEVSSWNRKERKHKVYLVRLAMERTLSVESHDDLCWAPLLPSMFIVFLEPWGMVQISSAG